MASNAINLPSALKQGLPTRPSPKFVSRIAWDPSRFDTHNAL